MVLDRSGYHWDRRGTYRTSEGFGYKVFALVIELILRGIDYETLCEEWSKGLGFLVTVELRMLPGEAAAVAIFLQSKLKSQITIRGQEIEVGEERRDEVKFLIKKFLHQEGLETYRVLSERGTIRVVLAETERSRREIPDSTVKGVPPFPPLSAEHLPLMQTVYPNYGSSPILPSTLAKKKRK